MWNLKLNQPVWYPNAKKKAIVKEFLPNGLVRITYFHPETDERVVADVLRESLKEYREQLGVKVKKLDEDAIIPKYQSKYAAGFDIATTDDIVINPNEIAIAGTGLSFEIPIGYELEIRGRSGNAFKLGIFSFNGTIDADYRGEVKLLLINHGKEIVKFNKGDRVAQGIIKKIEQFKFIEVGELSDTERGESGFGSTGLK